MFFAFPRFFSRHPLIESLFVVVGFKFAGRFLKFFELPLFSFRHGLACIYLQLEK